MAYFDNMNKKHMSKQDHMRQDARKADEGTEYRGFKAKGGRDGQKMDMMTAAAITAATASRIAPAIPVISVLASHTVIAVKTAIAAKTSAVPIRSSVPSSAATIAAPHPRDRLPRLLRARRSLWRKNSMKTC